MSSWREGGWVGQMGGWMALLTVLLQLLFAFKYWLAVRTLDTKLAAQGTVRADLTLTLTLTLTLVA